MEGGRGEEEEEEDLFGVMIKGVLLWLFKYSALVNSPSSVSPLLTGTISVS